jgi:hypothetical protein
MATVEAVVQIDPDVLAEVRAHAEETGRLASDIVNVAVREYVANERRRRAMRELCALMDRVGAQAQLSEEESLALAYEELRAVRKRFK